MRTGISHIPTIKINGIKLDHLTTKLTIIMTIDSNILLEYIYFSFVLWVRSSELKVEIFLPSSADTAKKHQIIALNRIINNNFEYKGLSFSKNIAKGMTTCEGSRCSASCIPLQACIQSNGILVN